MSDLGKETKGVEHLSVGAIGEEVAARFLIHKGFEIIDTHVVRKWGELDIVARKFKRVHVVEVKTVSGTKNTAYMNPIENLTQAKLLKLKRTAQLYAKQHGISHWQLDAVLVWYNKFENKAEVEYIDNVF